MLRIGVDIGVAFTDFAAWRDAANGVNGVISYKVPSNPPDFAKGFVAGFAEILARAGHVVGEDVFVIHGTTVSINTADRVLAIGEKY